jgi:putative intracellular protease/amidase
VTASPSAEALSAGSTALTPELTLDQVRLSDFEGIILPSMAVEDETPIPGLAALLREAMATGKPVAAQTSSVVTLARAGILKGRRFAYPGAWVDAVPEFAEAVHAGEALVEDGDLITSAVCPYAARILETEDGTQALTGALIKRLW